MQVRKKAVHYRFLLLMFKETKRRTQGEADQRNTNLEGKKQSISLPRRGRAEDLESKSTRVRKDYLAAESFSLSHRLTKVSIETCFSFATASAFLAMLSSRAIYLGSFFKLALNFTSFVSSQ